MKNINPSFEIIANRFNSESIGLPLISLGGFFMEIFKSIQGYPKHQISNYGNVKSLDYMHTKSEALLNPSIDSSV